MTSRWSEWRARKRAGLPGRQVAPCGTYAAARRHQRNGEELDPACAEALREHNAEMYRRRLEK